MYRIAVFLIIFAAVTAVAQEIPDITETEAAQTQRKTDEQQAEGEVTDGVPEFFDPTEEISEDYPIEFPVDI